MVAASVEVACRMTNIGINLLTYGCRVQVTTDAVVTVWVAFNLAKLCPSPIRLPLLKAYDSFKYAGV